MTDLTERQEQELVIDWIDKQHPWLRNHTIYIINEKKCSVYAGKKLNKQGRLPGASDLFFAWPTNLYCGLFIEMKAQNGKLSKVQSEFLSRMNSIGYYACACYGFDQAIDVINKYLSNHLSSNI